MRELIPTNDPAPLVPGVNVEGEDDTWYIPLIMCCQIHALDEYSTPQVVLAPEYVEERTEDPVASPPQYDLAVDGLEDKLWANLGVQARQVD